MVRLGVPAIEKKRKKKEKVRNMYKGKRLQTQKQWFAVRYAFSYKTTIERTAGRNSA